MFSSPWFLAMFTCLANFFKKEGTFPQVTTIKNYELNPPYDFIIVGAGSAGSVLANRLSEEKDWKILLLESGGLENEISDTPFLAIDLWGTRMDWNYTTTEQKICKVNNGKCLLARGHVLGGSSTLNFMNYVRGNKVDYNEWEDLGNEGWGYNNIFPYFLKSEDIQVDELKTSKYHCNEGPLTVSNSKFKTACRNSFISAAQELGYIKRDYNGEIQTGVDYAQFNIRDGSRCSTAKAFLDPLSERTNVHIVIDARVTEVVIVNEGNTRRASGVKFHKKGETYFIEANKEVILSSGSINTPQLLMLSGIGKKEHLEDLNIPVKLNLPVGDNLQDHSVLFLSFHVNNVSGITREKFENSDEVRAYSKRGGILSSPLGIETVGHFSLNDDPRQEVPDIQVFFSSLSFYNLSDPAVTFAVCPLSPKSVGNIRLLSSNPEDPPLINPNYLSAEGDFDNMIKACKFLFKLSATSALYEFSPTLSEPLGKCIHLKEKQDDLCKCLVEYYADTMYHPVGTAKMGNNPDNSVVSPKLLVHGTTNLRVVDGSIMPSITRGNTNAPIIMIAEKASDLVKQDWKH